MEVAKSVILAESRDGIVEFIDPANLATMGRMHVRLPEHSIGLNGIAAGTDGSTLYLKGPIPGEVEGCCALYAVDLVTLQARQAASIPGSDRQVARRVRQAIPQVPDGNPWHAGAWSGNRSYVYTYGGAGSARLWTISTGRRFGRKCQSRRRTSA